MELNRIDLNKLYVFFAIAEHGGVARAARRLGRTPSAVSQSLSALEDSIEVRLFDRVGRKLLLTREGEQLRRRFAAYQDALQLTVDDIRNEDGEVRGVVRLGLFLGFPSARLAQIIAGFTALHPKAGVRVVHQPYEELAAGLARSQLDFVVSFRPGREEGGRTVSTPLFEQELVLATGRKYLRGEFDPDALRGTPVIDYFRTEPLISRWLEHHTGEAAPPVPVRVWAATTDLVVELLLCHAGVGVVPRYLVEPWLRRRRLRIVETGRPELRDSIWLDELKDRNRRPVLDAFRQAILADFS